MPASSASHTDPPAGAPPPPPRTAPAPAPPPRTYRAFLAGRWAPRARLLGLYALVGNLVLLGFDAAFVGALDPPRTLLEAAALRLPWMVLPALGWLAARTAPGSRLLPPIVIVLSVVWTWGNDLAYFALGLAGSTLQTVAVVLSCITAATFLPVRLRGRLGVFALMGTGHVILDLAWPQARPVADRLRSDLALLSLVAVHTVVFEQFAAAQRRRFILHRDLERKVAALEANRLRADQAATALGQLDARVAHEINNPLAAVKVNVRWLGEPQAQDERAEVVGETLEAVGRIARSVAALEAPPVTPATTPAAGLPVPGGARLA